MLRPGRNPSPMLKFDARFLKLICDKLLIRQYRLVFGGENLIGETIECVVSFIGALLGTKDQPDRRILAILHPVFASVIEIEMHLAGVRVTELSCLQVDDEQAAQTAMEEHKVNPKPGVIDPKPLLPSKEREIVS